MQNYTGKTLGYDKVKQILQELCETDIGQQNASAMEPLLDINAMRNALAETTEMVDFISLDRKLNFYDLIDIADILKDVQIPTTILNPDELLPVGQTASVASTIRRQLRSSELSIPLLKKMAQDIADLAFLAERIDNCIDSDGSVKDSASPKLLKIRRSIARMQAKMHDDLAGMLQQKDIQHVLQDNVITQREGRYVIPIRVSAGKSFKGIVHGRSSSGSTLYVEPMATVEGNNQIAELRSDEKAEIFRILSELSEQVRAHAQELLENEQILGKLDFLQSKALFSREIQGQAPRLSSRPFVVLKECRHPLLIWQKALERKSLEEVVPTSLELGKKKLAIIITGANTGGKTITLKTVGLSVLMAYSGLHLSCREGTEIGLFANVMADIGDEQSIEKSLSTFSSHLTHLIEMTNLADEESLFLMDEIGAGTAPEEGSALAVSLIEHLLHEKARLITTTHYGQLKIFAGSNPDCMNAAMSFDNEKLQPTYHLLPDIPGKSYALEIASRYGMPTPILERAHEMVGKKHGQIDNLITELEKQKKMFDEQLQDLQLKRDIVENKLAMQKNKEKSWKDMEKKIREEAKREAEYCISKANKRLEGIIRNAQESSQKSHVKKEVRQLQEQVGSLAREINEQLTQSEDKERIIRLPKPEVGDKVWLKNMECDAKIMELKGREAVVLVGDLQLSVNRDQLYTKFSLLKEKEPEIKETGSFVSRVEHFHPEIDLRGCIFDEAMPQLDRYFDEALQIRFGSVRIIHGKGTGALRAKIHRWLKNDRRVVEFHPAEYYEGGAGVTVVVLKV